MHIPIGNIGFPNGRRVEEISIPENHSPFGNCIPVRVNQVIKGIEISQWPLHIPILINLYRLMKE